MTRLSPDLHGLPSWVLTPDQLAVLDLLAAGWLAPLERYLPPREAARVREEGRLADGSRWFVPITLEVDAQTGAALDPGTRLVLRDLEGVPLAILSVQDVAAADDASRRALAGPLALLGRPSLADFADRRDDAASVRQRLREWRRTVLLPAWDAIPAALARTAHASASDGGGGLLIVACDEGEHLPERVRYARVRAHEATARALGPHAAVTVVSVASGMDSHARLRLAATFARACGASHLAVDPRDAPPGSPGRRALDDVLAAFALTAVEVPEPASPDWPGRDEVEARLAGQRPLPDAFLLPAAEAALRRAHPPAHRRGVTVFFTGLSGSGKSTIASRLRSRLLERGDRTVTLLDGDVVRRHLSSELGFTRAHRELNIRRIAYVAAEITKHGGIAICAPIAPYDAGRREARRLIGVHGQFVLVHVDTPLEVCERRDRKGLYARARAGLIAEFTGISDPYETPTDADLTIHTTACTPDEAVEQVLGVLRELELFQ